MSLKTKINSLRCQKWYGFAKQKMMILQEGEIPFKAYVINGYHIILKALINLAIIKAPPGIAIFRKGKDKYGNSAVVVNYADMYGNGKERPIEIPSLRGASDGEPPINPLDTGWPGNILALALGGFDFISLLFGCKADRSIATPSYFTTYPAALYLQTLAVAAYSIRYKRGFINAQDRYSIPHIFALANIGDKHYYVLFTEARNYDAGYQDLLFGFGLNKPYGIFTLINYPLSRLVDRWSTPENAWDYCWVVYAYCWKYYSVAKAKDVLRTCWLIQGGKLNFQRAGMVWFFTELEIDDNNHYYIDLRGETFSQDVHYLVPYNEYASHTALEGIHFAGEPATQPSVDLKIKTLVFPIPEGKLVFMQWNHPNLDDPSAPIWLVVDEENTPYIHEHLYIPYVYDIEDLQINYKNPFCVLVSDNPTPSLYLYWEEWMRYGGEETDIINLKYGTPLTSDAWIDFPALGEKYHLTNFVPIKITWEHRIVLATIYREDDLAEIAGMYNALLDTKQSNAWIIGSKFSGIRLDRCTPTIFGEHPYVYERMKYGGTQWGWDYSYCENYPEPPEGYPT